MAKEQAPQAQIFGRYQTPGRKTTRFANDDQAPLMVGIYESQGYTIDKAEDGHVIMSCTDEQAEKNRLAGIDIHNRQVKPNKPHVAGEGVKPVELTDERRSTPDMAPPGLDEL